MCYGTIIRLIGTIPAENQIQPLHQLFQILQYTSPVMVLKR
ncbi:hypothetical protein HALLA_06000 [Halostagnicola larsenii XH-48]|uniref:Uncharacterized protein n=1 Tax=Halostagnicola larsenii XH-48 TaxID=797299 RepID=W0JTX7_9EURY|nr:hypothetical protein HALLA_06000 [Halostagnicola larsenii XH-48]